ncbi:inactive glucose-1-phosphate adenylyltransferase small subunit 2, chloroplastic isoform X1 [Rhododendron vialii]|uniref:inactive glucose-1-phosphate adenylyltransferase small subunit 2, chloroplastic isoform X1 n=1 Tax=Rhododendron vialii TaxID=182163 RepID=UPI00265FE294|nr:inactive glucose-1-phosphate adenylyltransferase small subunit 2, chloroplastic isoform X1 [Rhododendron vialii]
MLELSVPTSANLKAKLLVAGLDRKHHQPRPPKLHSSILPSLSITNSQQPAQPVALFPPVNQSVAAIVFGDGSDSRLYPLTKRRSEGAIPIAANYRLIDAVVSNCINSNINKIYALTQFNSTSLNSHLTRAYSGVGLGKEGFVEVIAACQSPEYNGWFQGTADAIRRCLWVLEEYPIVEFLVLPGHHLYKMDYQKLIEAHRKKKSDVTCAVLTGKKNQVSEFGIFEVNSDNKVTNFREKPDKNPMKPILVKRSVKSNDSTSKKFPGMGIYVINRDAMIKLLREHFPEANVLKSEVIPGAISLGMKVNAYRFDGYWEDMRSIEAFYDANMESTKKANMGYNFYDKDSPLYTLPRNLPPSLVTDAVITDSVIGDGCILNKCSIKGTVVGMRTRIGDGALIEDSVLMGSDIYQIQDVQTNGSEGMGIPIGIGEGSHIRRAIVDKNARIGKNVMIINKDNVQEANMEAHGYSIKEGIVIILRSAVIKDGSIL